MNMTMTMEKLLGEIEQPIQFAHDPLVLSTESYLRYRARRDDPETHNFASRYHDLDTLDPSDQAHELAVKIRRYYLDSLCFQRLRNQPISEFRQKLYSFLMGQHQLKNSELGMVYKLPYFYAYDQELLDICHGTTSVTDNTPSSLWRTKLLTPLHRMTRDVREKGTKIAYWWLDEQKQAVTMEATNYQRDLVSIMDGLFQRPQKFDAVFRAQPMRVMPQHQVWWMSRPRIAT
jgi:hypothetical protein